MLVSNAWFYNIAILLTMGLYGIYRRQKPNAPKHHMRFILFAGLLGGYFCDTVIISSTGGYCTRVTAWEHRAEFAAVWCVLSLISFCIYRAIMRVNEKSRMKAAIALPVFILFAPLFHFIAFSLGFLK